MATAKKLTVTIHEHQGDWILRVHSTSGSITSLAAFNDEESAEIVRSLLQAVLVSKDPFSKSYAKRMWHYIGE